MNEQTQLIIKSAAILGARALRHYRLKRYHNALQALKDALDATAEALELLESELNQ